jgi:DNA-binding Lrp family transcriptional regulator
MDLNQERVLEAIQNGKITINEISAATGMSEDAVMGIIRSLQAMGHISVMGFGPYMRISERKPMFQSFREYAALTNSPILYSLGFEPTTHQIAGKWAYLWLIDFVNYPGLVVFHPQALRLVLDNLPKWKSPLHEKDDYELFLDGAFSGSKKAEFEQLAKQAVQIDAVLFRDATTKQWMLQE